MLLFVILFIVIIFVAKKIHEHDELIAEEAYYQKKEYEEKEQKRQEYFKSEEYKEKVANDRKRFINSSLTFKSDKPLPVNGDFYRKVTVSSNKEINGDSVEWSFYTKCGNEAPSTCAYCARRKEESDNNIWYYGACSNAKYDTYYE